MKFTRKVLESTNAYPTHFFNSADGQDYGGINKTETNVEMTWKFVKSYDGLDGGSNCWMQAGLQLDTKNGDLTLSDFTCRLVPNFSKYSK